MNRKELESDLRRAFWVDNQLPLSSLKRLRASLGKFVLLPDERPIDEIFKEKSVHECPTREDLFLWEKVMFRWIPLLAPEKRNIVKRRSQEWSWKKISYEFGISQRTAQRRYVAALDTLLKNI